MAMRESSVSLSRLSIIVSSARRNGALRIWLTDEDAVALWALGGVSGVSRRDLPSRFCGLPVVVGIGRSRVVFAGGSSVAWSLLWESARV